MVQMSVSMLDFASVAMGAIILGIGVVLAATAMIMAVTSLINSNVKNVAIMKTFGYGFKECALTIFGGYHAFAFAGFALGTVYQWGLLELMVELVFKDVAEVPDYNFNVPVFFITLAAFIICYEVLTVLYALKLNKIQVKEIMLEN